MRIGLLLLTLALAAAEEPATALVLITEAGAEDGSQPAVVVERRSEVGPEADRRLRLFGDEVGALWGAPGSLYVVSLQKAPAPAAPDAWLVIETPRPVDPPAGVDDPLAGVDDAAFRRKLGAMLGADVWTGPAPVNPAEVPMLEPEPQAEPEVESSPPVEAVRPPPLVSEPEPPPPPPPPVEPLPEPVVHQAEVTNLGGYGEVLVEYRGQLIPGRARLVPGALVKEAALVEVLATDGRFAVLRGEGLWVLHHLVLRQTAQGKAP